MLRSNLLQSSQFVGLASLALAGCLTTAASAALVNPVQFTAPFPIAFPNPPKPIGFTFAGNKFVGTLLGDGTGGMYSTDLSGGSISPFGGTVNLQNGHGFEHYVAASQGLGGFPAGDIYVASDSTGNTGFTGNIQHISNAGVPDGGLFVGSSTPLNGRVRGITFDTVGTFGNDMLVTTDTGYVYRVNNSGIATNIAKTGEDTEGLDVAPLGGTWGGFNGWLFVASEGGGGTIRAIKPTNTVVPAITIATNVASAEQLDFVPLAFGGNSLEGLYSANYPNDVLHAPYTNFTTIPGDIIITGETNSNIYDLAPGATPTLSIVGAFPNQPEDGLFVTAAMVPEPGSLTILGAAAMMVLRGRARRTGSRSIRCQQP